MNPTLQLTFHKERSQPLSDLVRNQEAHMYLYSETPIELNVSIMTSRGLTFFDRATLDHNPYMIPYTAPWGRDWSVLQLQTVSEKSQADSPQTVFLRVEQKVSPKVAHKN